MAMYLSIVRADNVTVDKPNGKKADLNAKFATMQFETPPIFRWPERRELKVCSKHQQPSQ
jgi:hypothetical protein